MFEHLTDPDALICKLAALCKMSVPQVRAFLPMKIPIEDLKTFEDAEVARRFECITEKEWREFCYHFRDKAFKFSDLGKVDAARHAEENGLHLPHSDRDPE